MGIKFKSNVVGGNARISTCQLNLVFDLGLLRGWCNIFCGALREISASNFIISSLHQSASNFDGEMLRVGIREAYAYQDCF